MNLGVEEILLQIYDPRILKKINCPSQIIIRTGASKLKIIKLTPHIPHFQGTYKKQKLNDNMKGEIKKMRTVKAKNVRIAKYISDIIDENYSTTDIRNYMLLNINKNETH